MTQKWFNYLSTDKTMFRFKKIMSHNKIVHHTKTTLSNIVTIFLLKFRKYFLSLYDYMILN